jgi:hypothetical protein
LVATFWSPSVGAQSPVAPRAVAGRSKRSRRSRHAQSPVGRSAVAGRSKRSRRSVEAQPRSRQAQSPVRRGAGRRVFVLEFFPPPQSQTLHVGQMLLIGRVRGPPGATQIAQLGDHFGGLFKARQILAPPPAPKNLPTLHSPNAMLHAGAKVTMQSVELIPLGICEAAIVLLYRWHNLWKTQISFVAKQKLSWGHGRRVIATNASVR